MYRREEEWKIQNDLLVTKRGIIDEIDFARKERNQVNMELARLKASRDKYVADNAMQQALIENKGNEITRLKSIIDGLIASIPKQFIIQGK